MLLACARATAIGRRGRFAPITGISSLKSFFGTRHAITLSHLFSSMVGDACMRHEKPTELFDRPVSAVLQDYLEPFLLEWIAITPQPSLKQLNAACQMFWCIWNAVVLHDNFPECGQTHLLDDMARLLGKSSDPNAMRLVDFYVQRKRTLFSQYQYTFGDFEFYKAKDGEVRCRAAATQPKPLSTKSRRILEWLR